MKKNRFRVVAIITMCCLLMSLAPFSVAETVKENWSWDEESGRLAVDYGSYLSQHDLIYTALPADGETEGMPVANGQTGAMVWQDDGIRMQIHSVDNALHSAFSAAQVRLSTTPSLNGDEGFEQRLHLYDGYVSVAQNKGFTAEIFGVPDSETMALHVKDTRQNVDTVALDVELWVPSDAIVNASGTADAAAWKTVTRFEKEGVIGFTKGISLIEPFGYAFAVAVDGADYTVIPKDEKTARIYITLPESGEYTVWMNASSRCRIEKENIVGAYQNAIYESTAADVFAAAYSALETVREQGYENALNASKGWWHDYWERSFLHYENTDAAESDYLENFYYLAQYQFGGAAYATYPQHFMRSVYNARKDEDMKWNNAYWHFNQRAIYQGFLSSNRVEGYLPYLNFYNGVMEPMTTYTQGQYNDAKDHGFIDPAVTDAMKTWETICWDGNGFNNDHTGLIFSTGFEIAENMYHAYQYSMDEELLERYYEYIRRTVRFITEWARWDEETGNYQLDYSNALETWWRINNCTVDNAAIRSLLPMFLEAATLLGRQEQDAELIAKAADVLEKLEPITLTTTEDGKVRYAAYDVNDYTVSKTNRQSPELEIVYPHDLVGVDHEDLQIAINTFGESYKNTDRLDIWNVDGLHAARLGLGDDTVEQMGNIIELTQKRVCGGTDDGNGKMEGMGLHISIMNEMMLQSYDGVIRVFPAVPSGDFRGAFTLLANGGFLVSSEYADGAARFVGLKSQHGGTATVKCPWEVSSVLVNGKKTAVVDGRIVLETEKGEGYLIQPVSDVEFETVTYTAAANSSPKQAFGRTLGISAEGRRTGVVSVELDFNDPITDNAFTDKRGSNTAAVKGSGTTVVARGNGDQAVEFNGSGYLQIPTSATFDPMSNFTVSFEMNTTATGTMVLFDKYGANQGFYLDLYQKKLRVMIGNNVLLNVDAAALLDGTWHTVQVDVDTDHSTVTLRFDGVQKGQATYTGNLPAVEQAAHIGSSRHPNYGYVGMLDNFKMVSLGAEEVAVDPQDDLYAVSRNQPLAVGYPGVLANDTADPVGLQAALTQSVQNGALQFFSDGAFVYTPDEDFVGLDAFTYRVTRYGEPLGSATVTLQVGILPEAVTDVFTVFYGESLHGNVVLNDAVNGDYTVEFVPTEAQSTCPVTLGADGSFAYAAPALPTKVGYHNDPVISFRYRLKTEWEGETVYSEPAEAVIRVTRNTAASLYYDFNEPFTNGTVTDQSGNGNHGVIVGGVTRTEAGTVKFDGSSSVQIPHSDTFDLRDGFELSMKIKADKTVTQVLFDKSNAPGNAKAYGLYVDIYSGKVRVLCNNAVLLNVNCPFNLEEFTDLCLVYSTEEGGIKLYFDGKLAGFALLEESLPYVNSYAYLGSRLRDGTLGFAGELDDFRIRTYPLLQGDLDGDEAVTIADVTLLLQYLVGHDIALQGDADMNKDGRISVYDAVVLLRTISV